MSANKPIGRGESLNSWCCVSSFLSLAFDNTLHTAHFILAMEVLTYSPFLFNTLSDVDTAGRWDLDVCAQQLGEVILKHNLENVVAVSRNHKHFDLRDGEQVVCSGINAFLSAVQSFQILAPCFVCY